MLGQAARFTPVCPQAGGESPWSHCLDHIELVTPYEKAMVLLAQPRLTSWAVSTLRDLVLPGVSRPPPAGPRPRAPPAAPLHRRMPWARFALSVLGVLTGSHQGAELGVIINSGVLALVQSLLREIGEPSQYT